MAELLAPDPNLVTMLQTLSTAVTADKEPGAFRLGECNSFSSHGVDGVSNALGSALWALDFFFVNAQNGSQGINFHGGRLDMDGTTPFLYAPIAEDGMITGVNPIFYGMLLMARAGTGDVVSTTAAAGSVNFTAYTIARPQSDGSRSVILVNKDAMNGVNATVDMGAPVTTASAIYLQGGSLSAKTGVTLGGAGVTAAGGWSPQPPYALPVAGNTFTVLLPAASAALVRLP
jgi:hypothetical protein